MFSHKRFVCKACHQEVEAAENEIYKGFNSIGLYVECPECGTENQLVEEEEKEKHDDWWEEDEEEIVEQEEQLNN